MEKLGNPFSKRYPGGAAIYACNIWVMQEYQGKIYLGAGNSSNMRPASNAGPVLVITFDPKKKTFESERFAPDEQFDVLRVFSGGLYSPGHDL